MGSPSDIQKFKDYSAIEGKSDVLHWGVVSWHMPKNPRTPSQFPLGVFKDIHEYVPNEIAKRKNGIPVADDKMSSFSMLVDQEDGTFKLKVNELGWDSKAKIKDMILRFDSDNGPSLYSKKPIEIVKNKLYITEYRVHLTNGNTGLRDVVVWEDVSAIGAPPEEIEDEDFHKGVTSDNPKFVTSYVWCFTNIVPYPIGAEVGDIHFQEVP